MSEKKVRSNKAQSTTNMLNQYFSDLLNEADELTIESPAFETKVITEEVAGPADDEPQLPVKPENEAALTKPEWMTKNCAVLLFYTQSARLAVPIILLSKIIKANTRISRMPKMPEWGMGVIKDEDKLYSIIDTDYVLNKRQENDKNPPVYVLMIAETRLGLSCQSLGDIINLEANQIQWRNPRQSHRRWHVGTIRESLHLLLDPCEINEMYA